MRRPILVSRMGESVQHSCAEISIDIIETPGSNDPDAKPTQPDVEEDEIPEEDDDEFDEELLSEDDEYACAFRSFSHILISICRDEDPSVWKPKGPPARPSSGGKKPHLP